MNKGGKSLVWEVRGDTDAQDCTLNIRAFSLEKDTKF